MTTLGADPGAAGVPARHRIDSSTGEWARSPVAWIFAGLSVLGFSIVLLDYGTVAVGFANATTVSIVFLILTVVIGSWILARLRPFTNVPPGRALACLIWGMTAATGFAIVANTGLGAIWARAVSMHFANTWGNAFTAPIDEETLKIIGLVLLGLIASPWIRGPMDGFAYGSLIGLGFQVMENWTYAINSIVVSGGTDPVSSVIQSAFSRVLLTGYGSHWAMSAVAGAGLGFVVTRRRTPAAPPADTSPTVAQPRPVSHALSVSGSRLNARVVVGVALILLALTMHGFFNAPVLDTGLGSISKALTNLVIAVAVYLWLRHCVRRAAVALGVDKALLSRRGRRRVLKGQPPTAYPAMDRWIRTVEDRAYAAT